MQDELMRTACGRDRVIYAGACEVGDEQIGDRSSQASHKVVTRTSEIADRVDRPCGATFRRRR